MSQFYIEHNSTGFSKSAACQSVWRQFPDEVPSNKNVVCSLIDWAVGFQTQATLQPRGKRLSVHPFIQQLRPCTHICSDSRQSLSWAFSSLSSCEATDNRFLRSIHNMPLQTISGTVFISAMILWNNFFFNYVFTLRLRWKS